MKNYYLLFIAIIFICGIIFASSDAVGDPALRFLSAFIVILFLSLFLLLKRDTPFLVLLFILVFSLGAFRYLEFNRIESPIRDMSYESGKIFIQGRVVSDIEEKKRKRVFTLEARSVKTGDGQWTAAGGLVLVNLYGKGFFYCRYGDIVALQGVLREPPFYAGKGRFNYRKYLKNKRICAVLNVKKGFFSEKIGEDRRVSVRIIRLIYSIRAKLQSRIEEFIEHPYGAVLSAVLLGKRGRIPSGLRDSFARTGTLHILAISGLHVGIIYFVLLTVLKIFRIRKNLSIVICISFLISYAVLTGARASILRAATMFSILGLGEILKRKISTFNLIGLSCLVILMANPNQVFGLGFILSYAAVLSIISLSPVFYRPTFGKGKIRHYLLASISVSLAAWVGLLPLIAYYFGLVSPVVVIANLVVVPLLFFAMGAGLLFLSLGFLSVFLATIFAHATWFFLFLLINIVRFLNKIPFGCFEINSPRPWMVMLYYALLLFSVIFAKAKKPTFSFLT